MIFRLAHYTLVEKRETTAQFFLDVKFTLYDDEFILEKNTWISKTTELFKHDK